MVSIFKQRTMLLSLLLLLTTCHNACAGYECLCSYAVETIVHTAPSPQAAPIGYMYEFDCKPLADPSFGQKGYYVVQFEHQIGYVEPAGGDMSNQTCQGDPPTDDVVLSTTLPASSASPTTTSITSTALPETSTTPMTTSTPVTSTQKPIITTTTTPKPTTTTTTTLKPTTATTTTPQTTTTTTTTQKPSTTSTNTPKPTMASTTTASTTVTTTRPITTTMTTRLTTTIQNDLWLEANVSGTPLMYVGVGYDLMTGAPLSSNDTGFHLHDRIFQLTPSPINNTVKEVTSSYSSSGQCFQHKSTDLINSALADQRQRFRYFNISGWNSTASAANLTQKAFFLDSEFQNKIAAFQDKTRVIRDDVTTCTYGTVRYMTEKAEENNFHVTKEFAEAVCHLPKSFPQNKLLYMDFVMQWGTHVTTGVDVGTLALTEYQTTINDVFRQAQQSYPHLIQHTGQFEGSATSLTIDPAVYRNDSAALSHRLPGMVTHLSKGTRNSPAPLQTAIKPISYALNLNYWRGILDIMIGNGECPDHVDEAYIQTVQQNLILALQQYPAFRLDSGSYKDTASDKPLQVPVTWPNGTYSLMQAASGCPASGAMWVTGSRFQDTEDVAGQNTFSAGISSYLKGSFHSNNMEFHYCTKTTSATSTYRPDWPAGSYCIMKHGFCPKGFSEGYIFWDDDDTGNRNTASGTLPDGEYDRNTKIYYCCRSDGPASQAISLPTDKPFVMLRYKGACQTVYGTSLHELRVKWDDEDLFNKDSSSGAHPLDDGNRHEHILHFCHYTASRRSAPIIG